MFRFATLLRMSGLALAAALVFASAALAQQAPLVGIDPIRASLDQIETTAKRGGLGVRTLSDLSQQLSPLRDTLRDKLADLEPRLADLDARLKGLGAAPAKDAPPEDATIATERTRLSQQRAEMDAAVTRLARHALDDVLVAGRIVTRVAVTVRTATFYTRTKIRKLPEPTTDADTITGAALRVLDLFELDRPVRLVGVRLELAMPR